MKTAFLIEGHKKNPGGYNQVLNSVLCMNNLFEKRNDFIFITNNRILNKEMSSLNINSIEYKKNIFDKFFDYFFKFNFFFNFFIKINFYHSFYKFLKIHKVDLIIFLSPSELSLFCVDINFVLNIWDLDHKKNSPYPEHKKDFIFEKREEFLNICLFKAFKIIVPHAQNKKDLIKLYNCDSGKIEVQTLLPYLPNIPKNRLKFYNSKESEYIVNISKYKKIILYPATFWPHKNHKYLIDSAILLKNRNIKNFHFVMCGSDRGTLKYIKKLIKDNNLFEYVTVFSLVSNLFLKKLYENCFAVVMPTNSGPTNLPLYEAMYFKKLIFYPKDLLLDQDLAKIIIPINVNKAETFVSKLININKHKVDKKIKLGEFYYKKNCNKDEFSKKYIRIIKEFQHTMARWKI
jgi:glycosyltransferase involved in cell wall biosynthesis